MDLDQGLFWKEKTLIAELIHQIYLFKFEDGKCPGLIYPKTFGT